MITYLREKLRPRYRICNAANNGTVLKLYRSYREASEFYRQQVKLKNKMPGLFPFVWLEKRNEVTDKWERIAADY